MAATRGITFVGASGAASGANLTSGSWSLSGVGWLPGDFAIFVWYSRESGRTFTKPGTVTQYFDTSSAGFGHLFVGYRTLVAGDTTFAWSATSSTNNTDGYYMVVFRNVGNQSSPFERTSAATPTTFSNTASPDPPALSAATILDKDAVITIFGKNNDFTSLTSPPSGYFVPGLGDGQTAFWTETSGTDGSSALAYKLDVAAATTENPDVWDLAGGAATDDGYVWTAAIRSNVRDTLTADAYIFSPTVTGSFTANAVIRKTWGGGQSMYPRLLGTEVSTATASLDVPIPASAQAGELLIVPTVWDGTATAGTTPTGWALISERTGTNIRHVMFARTHNGSDTQVTVPISGTPAVAFRGQCLVYGPSTIEVATGVVGTSGAGHQTSASPATISTGAAFSIYRQIRKFWGFSSRQGFAVTDPGGMSTAPIIRLGMGSSPQLQLYDEGLWTAGGQTNFPAQTWTISGSDDWTSFFRFINVYNAAGFTADAWIAGHLTLDAVIASDASTVSGSFSADAVIKREQTGSAAANAVIRGTVAGTFTADAVIKREQTGTFTADATIAITTAGSFTANAVVRATVAGTFTANAVILRTWWYGNVEAGF